MPLTREEVRGLIEVGGGGRAPDYCESLGESGWERGYYQLYTSEGMVLVVADLCREYPFQGMPVIVDWWLL